jgi:hypothetical protein
MDDDGDDDDDDDDVVVMMLVTTQTSAVTIPVPMLPRFIITWAPAIFPCCPGELR